MSLFTEAFFNGKRAAKCFRRHAALFKTTDQKLIRKSDIMVLFFPVELKTLFLQDRNYPWQKPENCPCCIKNRLWGHGFAEAFGESKQPLLSQIAKRPSILRHT